MKAGLLCNDSTLKKDGESWRVEGDPTEGALIVSAMKAGYDPRVLEQEMPRLDTIPFESARQYMATLHDQGEGKPRLLLVKGSIESICVECATIMGPDGEPDIPTPGAIANWVESMADKGLRVLAFAQKEMSPDTTRITQIGRAHV